MNVAWDSFYNKKNRLVNVMKKLYFNQGKQKVFGMLYKM